MGDAVLEDFRGKDCAFVANWLRGKGLNKLVPYLKYFYFKVLILDSGFECMNVFYCCVYNEIQYLYRRFNNNIK